MRSRLALQQTAVDGHPGANTLAAFAEQTLPGRARAGLLEHLARCPECREILAAASAPEAGKAPGITWWKWRWAAAAAAACL
ncbi:MAG: zf-HC2 domain-containing protein, partial [Bryobacteraceae bacterium]